MEFIGVTTRSSSIMKLFPVWAEELGIDGRLVGCDLALDAPATAYREAVARIRDDRSTLGALVTTHKVAILESARDLFDELDPLAEQLGEVSSISKRDGRLLGHAKDPITAGRALAPLLGERYFSRTRASALIFGAGGAGAAIALHLIGRSDAPARITVTDVEPRRRDHVAGLGSGVHAAGAEEAAALLEQLPPGSLVVNATGMGKDRAGSPLPDGARFPREGVVWELNYRGELDFLRAAEAQRAERDLRVEDGWSYFLHGWSEVIAEVFGLTIDSAGFARLRALADAIR